MQVVGTTLAAIMVWSISILLLESVGCTVGDPEVRLEADKRFYGCCEEKGLGNITISAERSISFYCNYTTLIANSTLLLDVGVMEGTDELIACLTAGHGDSNECSQRINV